MRDDTKRKLDELAAGDRSFTRITMLLGAVLCVAVGVFITSWKTITAERLVAGNVTRSIWLINHKTGMRYPDIEVALDEGRLVRVGTLEPKLPDIRARVVLREKSKLIGFHSYSWEGKFEAVENP
ncbi:MAG: hypothetical protein HOP09_14930 [Hyphomicrobium sp.]|nr:hypothetical protein [Hyphomicrobium sp.]